MAHSQGRGMTDVDVGRGKVLLLMRLARRPWSWMVSVFLILPLLSTVALAAGPSFAPRAKREAAVARAKTGDPQGALVALREMLLMYPDDPRLLADTTIVANWAGEDNLVLELYACLQTPKNDAGVAEAAARSARNLRRYNLAFEIFGRAASLAPDRWQPRLGQAMALTDQGRYGEAEMMMMPLMQDHVAEPDVESGEAYLCTRIEDFTCAIDMDERLLAQSPNVIRGVRCELAEALSRIGAESLAQSTCNRTDQTDRLELSAAVAAEHVRWAETADPTQAQKQADAEQALAILDRVIAASGKGESIWKQAQSDRILALADLHRMPDIVQSYLRLLQANVILPDYALSRVAQAYLAVHQPRQAESLYRMLLDHDPSNSSYWSGLAYAQSEQERARDAFTTIDNAFRAAPALLQSSGLHVPQSNSAYVGLGTQAAEMRGYADMLVAEQRMLGALVGRAPANPDLARAMARTYLARGWPLLAIREERIADSFSTRDELPVLEDAEIFETAGRRDDADALIGPLLMREGNSEPITRFLEGRAIDHGWKVDETSAFEWSSGRFIGTTQHSEGHLYSPFADNRWRLYMHGVGDTGSFEQGTTWRSRTSLGVSYDYDRQTAWAEIVRDTGSAGVVAAGSLGAEFSLGDHWTFRAEGDTDNVTDVQLIAEIDGVHARSVDLSASWRQSELRSVDIGLQRLLFSDGNQRAAVTGSWKQRIWTSPRVQMNIETQQWTSTNSEDENRIYFNPAHDFSLGPKASVHWLTWRHYDRSLSQDFTFYAAPYWQKNYGVGGSFVATYGQQWDIRRELGVFSSITWNSQPYDGSNEPYTDLTFGVKWGIR